MKLKLLIALASFFCTNLYAAHIVGGDFTYKCLAPGQYDFTLTMYRDCDGNGGQFDSFGNTNIQASITIFRGNDPDPYETFFLGAPTVDLLDPEGSNPCVEIPPNICVQKGVYQFFRNVPVSNETYYVVYQRCCRNGTISNIFNPGQTGMTFVIELNPAAQQVCNNSPEFVDFPPPLVCTSNPLNFDHSATDADGDQLVYEFCSPLSGGSVNMVAPNPEPPPPYNEVNFQLPNFSAANPVGGNPQVVINSQTGIITGTPEFSGQYVVGVCVSEFRNGVLLSKVQRDFQFNVTPCDPIIQAGIQGLPDVSLGIAEFNVCGSRSVSIINQSTDVNFIQEYFWEIEIPGSNNFNFASRNVNFVLPDFGSYPGILVLNPNSQCSDSLEFVINAAPEVEVDFTANYDTCEVGPVQFIDLSPFRDQFPIVDWLWQLDDAMASAEQYPLIEYQNSGKKDISLSITDTLGCSSTVSGEIIWQPAPEIIIIEPGDFNICPETIVLFEDSSFPVDDSYTLYWDFGDGNTGSGLSTFNEYLQAGTYDVTLEITSPIGCYAQEVFSNLIKVDSFPVADFYYETPPDFNFLNPEIQLFEASKRAIGWDWLVPTGDTLEGPEAIYTFRDTGLQTIGLIVEHIYGCYDTIYKQIDVAPVSSFYVPNALTPNGDGLNEFWRPQGLFLEQLETYEVNIYDRWGGLIFNSRDPFIGWNGRTPKGSIAPRGGYIYNLSYKAPRKGQVELSGVIMIVH